MLETLHTASVRISVSQLLRNQYLAGNLIPCTGTTCVSRGGWLQAQRLTLMIHGGFLSKKCDPLKLSSKCPDCRAVGGRRPNVWPREELPQLEEHFQRLGCLIMQVGPASARPCRCAAPLPALSEKCSTRCSSEQLSLCPSRRLIPAVPRPLFQTRGKQPTKCHATEQSFNT